MTKHGYNAGLLHRTPTYKKILFYVFLPINIVLLLLCVGLFYALKLMTLGFYRVRIDITPNF